MSSKILVADDSPTIQKVVSITLAGTDYQLDAAHDENELFEKLKSTEYDLVLLDFSISEEASGYDLAKKIRDLSGSTRTLVMLGTFDTVDDHSMNESGVVDQIVKPFESSLFIEKVKSALEGESSFSSNEVNLSSEDNEWVMDNAPKDEIENSISEQGIDTVSEGDNPLNDVISGWGMSVPSVIGSEESSTHLPPKMNGGHEVSALTEGAELAHQISNDEEYEENSEEVSMPSDDELDYPEIDLSSEDSSEPTSKLVSLDELEGDQGVDLNDEEIEDTDPQFIIGPSEDSPDLIDALEEDVTPDEFWAADQDSNLGEEDSSEVSNLDETDPEVSLIDLGEGEEEEFSVDQHISVDLSADPKEVVSPTIDALNDISESEDIGPKLERVESTLDYDGILERLKADLRPLISEIAREVLEEVIESSNTQAAEKVAWEIIPDLAENLIRKEVENLSRKVQDKHSLS